MKEIVININKDGKVSIDVQGYTGGECVDATQAIEKALGQVTETTKKPEFHQIGEPEVANEHLHES